MTYFPSQEIDREVQNVMMEELESVKTVPGFHPNLVLQPLYESTIRAGRQRGGNAAGIEADGPLTGTWNDLHRTYLVLSSDQSSCLVDRPLGKLQR